LSSLILEFNEDEKRTEILSECLNNYEVGDESAEWPNNILSRKSIVYGDGTIARRGDELSFSVDPEELDCCKQLSDSLATVMHGVCVGMGSESEDCFQPFSMVASTSATAPTNIDSELIREKFGGTIFPPATIVVEALQDSGSWWDAVVADAEDLLEDQHEEYLAPWNKMIEWFKERPSLQSPVFVQIGDSDELQDLDELPEGTELVPGVLPRLVLALTPKGSLIGLFGYTVQS
jgi:hypothetical protein